VVQWLVFQVRPTHLRFFVRGKGNPGNGKYYVSNKLHSLGVVKVPWAREGKHVLKVQADGRNYPWPNGQRRRSSTYAWRSELGAVQKEYKFENGYNMYYTMSFWPDESWDQKRKYSIVISQWKMSGDKPSAALRLSNEGDYRLTFDPGWVGGKPMWPEDSDEGHGHPSRRRVRTETPKHHQTYCRQKRHTTYSVSALSR